MSPCGNQVPTCVNGHPSCSSDTSWCPEFNDCHTRRGIVSVCVPEPWDVVSDASNVIQLQRGDDPTTVISLGGEMRLDHEDALTRVVDNATAWCTASADYTDELDAIGGWPALQHRFTHGCARGDQGANVIPIGSGSG